MDKPTKEKFLHHKNWWHIFKINFKTKDNIKTDYIGYTAPERELGESKYGFMRLLKLSYKSFFALQSIKRLIVINIILMGLIFLLTSYGSILLSIFSIIIFLMVNLSFYIMVNHYSLDIIKIIETSLLEIER